jgi:hypothetical protein
MELEKIEDLTQTVLGYDSTVYPDIKWPKEMELELISKIYTIGNVTMVVCDWEVNTGSVVDYFMCTYAKRDENKGPLGDTYGSITLWANIQGKEALREDGTPWNYGIYTTSEIRFPEKD